MSALPTGFDYPLEPPLAFNTPMGPLKLVTFDKTSTERPRSESRGLPKPATGFARLEPTPELLANLKAASSRLESASPEEIIAWGVEHYAPYLTMATAFGPEGCVILAMLAKI